MRHKTHNLRKVIHILVEDQYEDGWQNVTDIDRLTDNILIEVESFLDSWPGFPYNRDKKGKIYA
jgi:hypothetical protein